MLKSVDAFLLSETHVQVRGINARVEITAISHLRQMSNAQVNARKGIGVVKPAQAQHKTNVVRQMFTVVQEYQHQYMWGE